MALSSSRAPVGPFAHDDAAPGRLPVPQASGRSATRMRRIAVHEAAHAVVGRALDSPLGGATIVEGADYGGMVWGPRGGPDKFSEGVGNSLTLFRQARSVMPGIGEARTEVGDFYQQTFIRIVELCAGTEGERALCEGEELNAATDREQIRLLAAAFCCVDDEEVIDRLIEYCRAEARAIIRRYRNVVVAVAAGLIRRRTLNGVEIDEIIFLALAREDLQREKSRRAAWAASIRSADVFEKSGGHA